MVAVPGGSAGLPSKAKIRYDLDTVVNTVTFLVSFMKQKLTHIIGGVTSDNVSNQEPGIVVFFEGKGDTRMTFANIEQLKLYIEANGYDFPTVFGRSASGQSHCTLRKQAICFISE